MYLILLKPKKDSFVFNRLKMRVHSRGDTGGFFSMVNYMSLSILLPGRESSYTSSLCWSAHGWELKHY